MNPVTSLYTRQALKSYTWKYAPASALCDAKAFSGENHVTVRRAAGWSLVAPVSAGNERRSRLPYAITKLLPYVITKLLPYAIAMLLPYVITKLLTYAIPKLLLYAIT